jgi:hypothetical protein
MSLMNVVGAGYLRVPQPRKYGLRPSVMMEDDPDGAEVYQTSFIHQVHCLVGCLVCYSFQC